MVRAQILSKNSDAVAISDNDLHITLAAGIGWQKLRSRIKAKDIDEPEFSIDIDPTIKVIEGGGSKSWYVKLKNQQDWKEYVMDSLQVHTILEEFIIYPLQTLLVIKKIQ